MWSTVRSTTPGELEKMPSSRGRIFSEFLIVLAILLFANVAVSYLMSIYYRDAYVAVLGAFNFMSPHFLIQQFKLCKMPLSYNVASVIWPLDVIVYSGWAYRNWREIWQIMGREPTSVRPPAPERSIGQTLAAMLCSFVRSAVRFGRSTLLYTSVPLAVLILNLLFDFLPGKHTWHCEDNELRYLDVVSPPFFISLLHISLVNLTRIGRRWLRV
jgi:hypothetical protein